MKIVIKAKANTGLYRDLQDSINAYQTSHVTMHGAVAGMRKALRKSKSWGESMGRWGSFVMTVDGKPMDSNDFNNLMFAVEDEKDAITSVARLLEIAINAMAS